MSEIGEIVDYLRSREEAVVTEIVSKNDDLGTIHRLLREAGATPAFKVEVTSSSTAVMQADTDTATDTSNDAAISDSDDDGSDSSSGRGRYGRPVRAMALEILESENRAWTSAEVQEAVRAEVGPERVDDRLKATVRTALWTLRTHGQSYTENGKHTATKWRTDTETPAAAGVSGTAPTNGLGGDDDQAQTQDHRNDLPGRDGVDPDRTSVG